MTETELKNLVLKQLDRDDLQPHLLSQMAGSIYGARLLKEEGKTRRLISLIREIEDPKEQLTAKHALLVNSYMLSELTDDELLAIFREWRSSKDLMRLAAALGSSSSLIARLTTLDQHDDIIDFIHVQPASLAPYVAARWGVYTHPEVIKKLKGRNEDADRLVQLMKETPSGYMYSRSTQLINSADAVGWILGTKGWAPFKEYVDRSSANNRRRVVESMVNHRSFPKLVRDHGHWDDLVEMVGDNEKLQKRLAELAKEK